MSYLWIYLCFVHNMINSSHFAHSIPNRLHDNSTRLIISFAQATTRTEPNLKAVALSVTEIYALFVSDCTIPYAPWQTHVKNGPDK